MYLSVRQDQPGAAAHSWAVRGERETEAVGGRLKAGRAGGPARQGGDEQGGGGEGDKEGGGWWSRQGEKEGGRKGSWEGGGRLPSPLAASKEAIFL